MLKTYFKFGSTINLPLETAYAPSFCTHSREAYLPAPSTQQRRGAISCHDPWCHETASMHADHIRPSASAREHGAMIPWRWRWILSSLGILFFQQQVQRPISKRTQVAWRKKARYSVGFLWNPSNGITFISCSLLPLFLIVAPTPRSQTCSTLIKYIQKNTNIYGT